MIYPIILRRLLPTLGFAKTVRILGFISLASAIVAIPILRQGRVVHTEKPRRFLDIAAFAEIPYLVYNIGGFLNFLGWYVPFVYMPIYAESHLHASTANAFDLIAYANAATFGGRLLSALAAQKVGVMTPWTICTFASGTVCCAWVAVSTLGGMIAFSILYGFFSGALTSLPTAILPYVSPKDLLGTRMGMTYAIAGTAGLIGSPIAGSLQNLKSENFMGLQLFCGIVLLSGACCQLIFWWLIREKLASSAARGAD